MREAAGGRACRSAGDRQAHASGSLHGGDERLVGQELRRGEAQAGERGGDGLVCSGGQWGWAQRRGGAEAGADESARCSDALVGPNTVPCQAGALSVFFSPAASTPKRKVVSPLAWAVAYTDAAWAEPALRVHSGRVGHMMMDRGGLAAG